jgi:ABC-type molybdenum transport system ATPase subunit/photorepair protein PhrA
LFCETVFSSPKKELFWATLSFGEGLGVRLSLFFTQKKIRFTKQGFPLQSGLENTDKRIRFYPRFRKANQRLSATRSKLKKMKENQHFGIVLTNNVDKNLFVQNILSQNASDAFSFLNQKKGILYSDLAIQKIIATEYQYDILIVAKNTGRKLQSFSSGEKKKAYLEYCISQNLDYLVLDNPLDHLDTQSRISILALLEKVSQTTIIIQIADRQSDILHFINKKFQIKDTTFEILALEKNGVALENNSQITIPNTDAIIVFDDEILIEFKSVSVQYEDKKVLDAISWTIKKGEFWQLIGPQWLRKINFIITHKRRQYQRIWTGFVSFWYKKRKRRKCLGYKKENWLL